MVGRLLLLLVLLSASAVVAFAASGSAVADASTPIIRDGLWVGMIPPTGRPRSLAIVGVRGHRVVYLRFMATLECRNVDSGEEYEPSFIGGKSFRPETIPRAGLLARSFVEKDAGRKAAVHARFDWRGRRYPLLVSFRIWMSAQPPEEPEQCAADVAIPARWTRAAVPTEP